MHLFSIDAFWSNATSNCVSMKIHAKPPTLKSWQMDYELNNKAFSEIALKLVKKGSKLSKLIEQLENCFLNCQNSILG